MGLEQSLLTRIVEESNEEVLRSLNLSWFREERPVLEYMREHLQEYGTIPSILALTAAVDFEADPDATEPLKFYVKQIERRMMRSVMVSGWEEAESLIRDGDEEKARARLLEMTNAAMKIGGKNGAPDVVSKEMIEEHIARYDKVKKAYGPDGVLTPWETLNDLTFGWHCGEFYRYRGQIEDWQNLAAPNAGPGSLERGPQCPLCNDGDVQGSDCPPVLLLGYQHFA